MNFQAAGAIPCRMLTPYGGGRWTEARRRGVKLNMEQRE
jgi:hypothetical protein